MVQDRGCSDSRNILLFRYRLGRAPRYALSVVHFPCACGISHGTFGAKPVFVGACLYKLFLRRNGIRFFVLDERLVIHIHDDLRVVIVFLETHDRLQRIYRSVDLEGRGAGKSAGMPDTIRYHRRCQSGFVVIQQYCFRFDFHSKLIVSVYRGIVVAELRCLQQFQ